MKDSTVDTVPLIAATLLMIFFTSDLHLGHANIIKYCDRPFSSVEEMDEALIRNWNDKITDSDDVYILGDFAFHGGVAKAGRLKGRKHLVIGNHDLRWLKAYREAGVFEWMKDYHELKLKPPVVQERQMIVMFHYSMRVWNKSHHGSWHLFGHSHGNLAGLGKSFDIGVDSHNYTPLSFDELKVKMDALEFKAVDHHGN